MQEQTRPEHWCSGRNFLQSNIHYFSIAICRVSANFNNFQVVLQLFYSRKEMEFRLMRLLVANKEYIFREPQFPADSKYIPKSPRKIGPTLLVGIVNVMEVRGTNDSWEHLDLNQIYMFFDVVKLIDFIWFMKMFQVIKFQFRFIFYLNIRYLMVKDEL